MTEHWCKPRRLCPFACTTRLWSQRGIKMSTAQRQRGDGSPQDRGSHPEAKEVADAHTHTKATGPLLTLCASLYCIELGLSQGSSALGVNPPNTVPDAWVGMKRPLCELAAQWASSQSGACTHGTLAINTASPQSEQMQLLLARGTRWKEIM